MNKEIFKEIINRMDIVKELDKYSKNRLANLMEVLLIEIIEKREIQIFT